MPSKAGLASRRFRNLRHSAVTLLLTLGEAASNIFAGAMGYYKNAFSHRIVGLSQAVQAASLILFANQLIAQADLHAKARKDQNGNV